MTSTRKGVLRYPRGKCNKNRIPAPTEELHEPQLSGLDYDKCAYDMKIKESTLPGLYHLTGRNYLNTCYMQYPGYIPGGSHGVEGSAIDTESELRSLNYKISKCPSMKYNPLDNCKECKNCEIGIPCGCSHCKEDSHGYKQIDCSPGLVPKYTRESKSCNILADINIDRFEPLCINPQDIKTIHTNDFIGVGTRNMMKYNKEKTIANDEFRTKCLCSKKKDSHLLIDCIYE